MAVKIKAVVLAAGRSTRMKSQRSKVLHPVLGKELIRYLLDALQECGIAAHDTIIVTGDNGAEIAEVIGNRFLYAVQSEPLGTAHALLSASAFLSGHEGDLLVLVGDNPNVTAAELQKLITAHRRQQAHCTFLSAVFSPPLPPYGRIVRDVRGQVSGIVEDKDATPEQRQIREMNASVYLFANPVVFPFLTGIGNRNAKGEFYLTDIIGILCRNKLKVEAVQAEDCAIAIGINDRQDLQAVQKKFNGIIQRRLMLEGGVTILQPETVTIEHDVAIGRDTVIYPCTYLAAGTRIGENCSIGPFVYLRRACIADGETIRFVRIEA